MKAKGLGVLATLVLTLLLFGVSTWLVNLATSLAMFDYARWGIPFVFFETWGPCHATMMNCQAFNGVALAGDLLVCCGIAALGVIWFARRKR